VPRYFFDVTDPDLLTDEVGEEFEGLNAARIAAVTLSGELLKFYPDRFWSVGEWRCSVRDESGSVLFVLHFYADGPMAVPDPSVERPSG